MLITNEKPRSLALHISISCVAGATRLKCKAIPQSGEPLKGPSEWEASRGRPVGAVALRPALITSLGAGVLPFKIIRSLHMGSFGVVPKTNPAIVPVACFEIAMNQSAAHIQGMADNLAEQGFMVKATIPMASGPGEQFFAVGKDTEPEALEAVRHHTGHNSKVEIGKRLSEEEIAGLELKPDEIRQYAP